MKYPISWLSEYVSIQLSPSELANQLCMAGFEVEALIPIGESLRGITTGKITDIQPHPQADRMGLPLRLSHCVALIRMACCARK